MRHLSARTVRLLGLDFSDLAATEVARTLADRPPDAAFAYMVTPNADHFVRLSRDPTLMRVYRQAWLRTLDSRVVARVARLLGVPVPVVAPGSDITAALLSGGYLDPEEPVTIIGLRPEWLPDLQHRCGLRRVAHLYPPFGFEHQPAEIAKIVDFVAAHPARFVFLAVGSPRQERLAYALAASGRVHGVGLCVGASLEFLSGHVQRAPQWMQAASMEWLHRLVTTPRLARRYLIDCPAVLRLLLRERHDGATSVRAEAI